MTASASLIVDIQAFRYHDKNSYDKNACIFLLKEGAVMKRIPCRGLVLAGFVLAATPLWAHHSNVAKYDATKRITLTGELSKVEWMNPHSHFYMTVKDAAGKVVTWTMEGYPPNGLLRTGWKTSYMKVGDTITVEGALARDGSNLMLGREVTLPDGMKLYWGPP